MPDDILLRIKTDRASTANTLKDIKAVQTAAGGVDKAFNQLGTGAQGGIRRLERTFSDARREVERNKRSVADLSDLYEALEQQERAVARAAKERGAAQDQANRGGTQNAQERFDQISREVGLAGDIQSNLGAIASLSGSQAVGAAGEIIALTEELPRLKAAIQGFPQTIGAAAQSLGAAGVAGAAAIAAITAALLIMKKQADEAKPALDGALRAQQDYYDALASSTTEQVRDQIATLEAGRGAIQAQIGETQAALESAFAQSATGANVLTQNVQFLADASARVNDALGNTPYQQLDTRLKELQEELQGTDLTIARLTQGVEKQAFATNDAAEAAERAAEAERKLTEERTQLVLQLAKEAGEDVAQRQRFSQLNTAQLAQEKRQREDRIQQIDAELEFLRASSEQNEQTQQQIEALEHERTGEVSAIEEITRVYRPLADARDAEAEALERQLSLIDQNIQSQIQLGNLLAEGSFESIDRRAAAIQREREAIENQLPRLEDLAQTSEEAAAELERYEGKLADLNREAANLDVARPVAALRAYQDAAEDVADAQAALADALAQSEAKIAQIRSNLRDKEADLLSGLQDTLAENDREAGRDRLAAVQEANEAREEAEADHQQTLNDIRRRFQLSEQTAVGSRDALAAFQARQQRDSELEAEQELYDARLDQIDTELKKQNALIDDRLKEQNRTADKRYREQLQSAQQAAQKQIDLERQRGRAEVQQRQQALNAALQQQQQYFAAIHQQGAQGYAGALGQFTNFISGLRQRVSGASGGSTAAGAAGAALGQQVFGALGNIHIPGFQGGGIAHGLARINERGLESGLTRDGRLALFGEPTRIFNAQQTKQIFNGGGQVSITLQLLDGKTIEATSRRQAVRVVEDVFDAAGL